MFCKPVGYLAEIPRVIFICQIPRRNNAVMCLQYEAKKLFFRNARWENVSSPQEQFFFFRVLVSLFSLNYRISSNWISRNFSAILFQLSKHDRNGCHGNEIPRCNLNNTTRFNQSPFRNFLARKSRVWVANQSARKWIFTGLENTYTRVTSHVSDSRHFEKSDTGTFIKDSELRKSWENRGKKFTLSFQL